jgi:hypothetical protein
VDSMRTRMARSDVYAPPPAMVPHVISSDCHLGKSHLYDKTDATGRSWRNNALAAIIPGSRSDDVILTADREGGAYDYSPP